MEEEREDGREGRREEGRAMDVDARGDEGRRAGGRMGWRSRLVAAARRRMPGTHE